MDSSSESDASHSILEINITNPLDRKQDYVELCSKVKKLHASYLFYRDGIATEETPQLCRQIYSTLVQRIGGTRDDSFSNGWKDLGYYLGLTGEEIGYIDNSMRGCPTDVTLRVFCQSEEATFDKIIQSLLEINRLDVIEGIFDPLQSLLNLLVEKYDRSSDQGYHSNVSNNSDRLIMRPDHFLNVLPEALKRINVKNIDAKDSDGDICAMPVIKKPSVLITYCNDGLSTAENIMSILREHTVNNTSINVISLEKEKATVMNNPEQYMRHYFEEVDYVVPILSNEYFHIIRTPASQCPSSLDNLDCAYARYLYTLMVSHYINGSGCLNTKVRGVLAQNAGKFVMSELYKYPLLSVWIREEQLNKLPTLLFQS